ncbi:hypothetical protein MCOR25_011016 [Pyricularia grisea]|nr:hypothetical protein MCOR25_011016 [Pyricularia grisea]
MRRTLSTVGILLTLATVVLGGPTLKTSRNAKCGAASGSTCLGSTFGNCCSKNGWCGSTDAYCGAGCQSGYGTCTTSVTTTTSNGGTSTPSGGTTAPGLVISTDAKCGNGFTCQGSTFAEQRLLRRRLPECIRILQSRGFGIHLFRQLVLYRHCKHSESQGQH